MTGSSVLPLHRTACLVIVRALLDRSDAHSEENRRVGQKLARQLQSNLFTSVSGDVLREFVRSHPGSLTTTLLCLLAPPHLRTLNVKKCHLLAKDVDGFRQTLSKCAYLQSVLLDEISAPEGFHSVVETLIDAAPQLSSISLEGVIHITNEDVQTLLCGLPQLASLNLSMCTELTDDVFYLDQDQVMDLKQTRVALPHQHHHPLPGGRLVSVDLSGCQLLTNTCIRHLLELCGPSLRRLNVSCTDMDCTLLWYLSGHSLSSAVQLALQSNKRHNVETDTGVALDQLLRNFIMLKKKLNEIEEDERAGPGRPGSDAASAVVEDVQAAETACGNGKTPHDATTREGTKEHSNILRVGQDRCGLDAASAVVEDVQPSKTAAGNGGILIDATAIAGKERCTMSIGQDTKLKESAEEVNDNTDLVTARLNSSVASSDAVASVSKSEALEMALKPPHHSTFTPEVSCWTGDKSDHCDGLLTEPLLGPASTSTGGTKDDKCVCNTGHECNNSSDLVNKHSEESSACSSADICIEFQTSADEGALENMPGHLSESMAPICFPDFHSAVQTEYSTENLRSCQIGKISDVSKVCQLHEDGSGIPERHQSFTEDELPLRDSGASELLSRLQGQALAIPVGLEDTCPSEPGLTGDLADLSLSGPYLSRLYQPNITSLDLTGIAFDHTLIVPCLEEFFSVNKHLQKLVLSQKGLTDELLAIIARNVEELRFISMFDCPEITNDGLAAFLKQCPKLQHLDIQGLSHVGDRGIYPIFEQEDKCRMGVIKLAETCISDVTLMRIARVMGPKLQELELLWCEEITDRGLHRVALHCPGLQTLQLRQLAMSSDTLLAYADHCPRLEHVGLSGVSCMTDEVVVSMAEGLKRLQTLDVSWNSDLTNAAVSAILSNCPLMSKLLLMGLKQISEKPFLPIIANYSRWRRCQMLIQLKVREQKLRRETGMPQLSSDEEFEDLYVPHRSTSYVPSLRHLNLSFCDHVSDNRLQEIVAVCRGTLTITDYYGEDIVPKLLHSL